MHNLQALQSSMAKAILGGEIDSIVNELRAGTANPAARFRIFRNNTYASLSGCLKAIFPVTMQLSDERFFAYAAHEFILARPPREARLSTYGAEFPRFLATFKPCRDFPVIAEMAALEWAIAESLGAAEDHPAPISCLKDGGFDGNRLCLRLQPNLRFTISRWPLLGVWADHKGQNFAITATLKKKTSRLAIRRHGEDIQLLELGPARFCFWRALKREFPIEIAAQKALCHDPLFDLVQETLALFRAQLVIGVVASPRKGIQS